MIWTFSPGEYSEEQKGYKMVSPLELIEKNPQPPEPIVDLLLQEKG